MSARTRHGRGQVLVLACIVFMTCALMLMASFSLANVVHERIRIQAAADAHALSAAILEARAFNTLGLMNRAIAGAMVSAMGLHSLRAIADRDVEMLKAGADAFSLVAIMEFGQCPPYAWVHCGHGMRALQISSRFRSESNNIKNQIQSKDQKWRDAIRAYSDMIARVYEDEKKLVDRLKVEVGPNSQTLRDVVARTAPRSSLVSMQYNQSGLACALEGSSFDGECQKPSWKNAGTVASASDRIHIMESAARAARPDLQAGESLNGAGFIGRGLSGDDYRNAGMPLLPVIRNPQKAMDIQGDGEFIESPIASGDRDSSTVQDNKLSGKVSKGLVVVKWQDGIGIGNTSGRSPSTDNDWKGIPCDGSGGCFINFRLIREAGETDFGQPTTYAAVRQDLRQRRGGAARPWELNRGSVDMPGSRSGTFTYVPTHDGTAVAKGKTYFHQLGQWSTPPNFFDPFWRPKLHPFVREELADVLRRAGDSDGAQIINGGQTAVEGRR